MLQFTGPVQDRGGETIDFLPIWLCVDPRVTFIFITQAEAERRRVSYLFFAVSKATGIIRVRGGQVAGERGMRVHRNQHYMKYPRPFTLPLCLGLSESVHHLLCFSESALSPPASPFHPGRYW